MEMFGSSPPRFHPGMHVTIFVLVDLTVPDTMIPTYKKTSLPFRVWPPLSCPNLRITTEYRCSHSLVLIDSLCRKDSFVTHRAFCDALAEESARLSASQLHPPPPHAAFLPVQQTPQVAATWSQSLAKPGTTAATFGHFLHCHPLPPLPFNSSGHLSATALLQKATAATEMTSQQFISGSIGNIEFWNKGGPDGMTRDFLGLTRSKNLNMSENDSATTRGNNTVAFTAKASMGIHQGYVHGVGEQQPSVMECDAFSYAAGTWTFASRRCHEEEESNPF